MAWQQTIAGTANRSPGGVDRPQPLGGRHPVPGGAGRCVVCGGALTRHQQFAGALCGRWQCRWAHLDGLLAVHRAEAATALGVRDADRYPPVVVPCREHPVVPLPRERAAAFREHLERIADAVGSEEARAIGRNSALSDGSPPLTPAEAEALARVCAVCRGACCYHGAGGAFLEAEMLPPAVAERGRGLVGTYLEHVASETYRGSCVYHTPRGCALPTDLRAPICGAYRCRGLRDQLDHVRRTGTPRGFVVVRHDHRIVRAAFIDGTGIRPFPAE